MFVRGDGKSHIELGDCFAPNNRKSVNRNCTRAFLNPPFSQQGEPERAFIDTSMDAVKPEGIFSGIIYAGIFADDDHKNWRREFLRRHTLLAMISMPEDLFYPTAAPTSIIVAQAHVPQPRDAKVMMAKVWNDGFRKLKTRRVEQPGSQLQDIKTAFDLFMSSQNLTTDLASTIPGVQLLDGGEWSPEQWLPQPKLTRDDLIAAQENVARSIYQAVARFPELADQALSDPGSPWLGFPALPLGGRGTVSDFFEVNNGRSTGESNYPEGDTPYVSSGDASNSIIRLVSPVDGEIFPAGGITVTAFGAAAVQPWPFVARGNGGSAVRILIPKYNMSFRELVWFAAQINIQRWRFFYARMAIKSRIVRLYLEPPPNRIPDSGMQVGSSIRLFRDTLNQFSSATSLGSSGAPGNPSTP